MFSSEKSDRIKYYCFVTKRFLNDVSELISNTTMYRGIRVIEKKRLFYPFLLIIIFTVLFGGVLTAKGTYGLYSDWPIPPLKEQIYQQVITDVFYAWSPNHLGYERIRQSGNYIDLINLAISIFFGVGGEVISKYPVALLFVIPHLAYYTLRKFKIEPFYAFIGALYYSLCVPLLYDSLLSGYLKFIVSYAAFPLFLLYLKEIVVADKYRLHPFLSFTLSYIFVATTINFFFISTLPIAAFLILAFFRRKMNIKYFILVFSQLFMSTTLVVLSQATAYFIPLRDLFIGTQDSPIKLLQGGLVTFLTFSHPFVFNAFRQFGAVLHFYEEGYATYGLQYILSNIYFSVTLFLIYIGVIFNAKKKEIHVTAMYVCSVFSVFVLKGINPPFGDINLLFYKTPFMVVLRNISYITFITGFSYAFLLAYSSQNIREKLNFAKPLQKLFPLFIIAMLYIGIYPIRSGKLLSKLNTYAVHPEEVRLYEAVSSEEGTFYVYNLPQLSPFYYTDAEGRLAGPSLNPFISYPPKPSLASNTSTTGRSNHFNAFLDNTVFYDGGVTIAPLLNLANIRYVTINPNFDSVFPRFINVDSNKWFKSINMLQNLSANNHFSELQRNPEVSNDSIKMYVAPNYLNSNITFTDSLFLNIGDYRSYIDHYLLLNRQYNGVFADDYEEPVRKLFKFVQFTQNGKLDAVVAFISSEFKYEPAMFVDKNRNNPKNDWTPIYGGGYWWYDYVLSSNAESMLATTLTPSRFIFPVKMTPGKSYVLLAKLLLSSSGSEVKFELNDQPVGKVETKTDSYRGNKYVYISNISTDVEDNRLRFISMGGTNSVYKVIVVPTEDFIVAIKETDSILEQLPFFISYSADAGKGVGSENPIFDFYYSRPAQDLSTSQTLIIDIPKAAHYDVRVLLKKRVSVLSENIESSKIKTVLPDSDIYQKIQYPKEFENLELCIMTTYISSAANRPSKGIPEKPLEVYVSGDNDAVKILSRKLYSSRVYSPGDLFYNCFRLDDKSLDSQGGLLTLKLSSQSEDVRWGIPIMYETESEFGYKIKYQLRGEHRQNITDLSVIIGSLMLRKSVSLDVFTPIQLSDDSYFDEGPLLLTFDCGPSCLVDRVFMSKGTSLTKILLEDSRTSYNTTSKANEFTFSDLQTDHGLLLFKQSYDNDWRIGGKNIKSEGHVIINGYQNGWVISNFDKKLQGSVVFAKQLVYNIANIISIAVILTLIFIYIVRRKDLVETDY